MAIRHPPVTTIPLADRPKRPRAGNTAPPRGGKTAATRRGGRPTRADAERLGETILDVATALFLADGYGVTSIETIARRARISKRTFYHRFPDKAALFDAVIRRIVERLRPSDDVNLFTGPLDKVLLRVARAMLRATVTPEALGLYRVIIAESGRFPELAATMAGRGAREEGIVRIAALLERELAQVTNEAASFAAAQFMSMVIALPQRRALGMGVPMTEAELDAWVRHTVKLFLGGLRAWSRT